MSLQHKKWEKNNITKAIWHWELLLFWITNATSQRWKISTLFWGTSGICVYSPRRCAPRWINHISPRCLKITYTNTYSTQLFQLRFRVLPQLSGKVEKERERLNTVLKCGRPYPTLQVTLYLVRYNPSSRLSATSFVSRQLVRTLGLNCALKRSK
jgi:hypothetical protein